jgi:hypothetical protein
MRLCHQTGYQSVFVLLDQGTREPTALWGRTIVSSRSGPVERADLGTGELGQAADIPLRRARQPANSRIPPVSSGQPGS